jgi:Zn-dependent peptidase ImmA (M78 family)
MQSNTNKIKSISIKDARLEKPELFNTFPISVMDIASFLQIDVYIANNVVDISGAIKYDTKTNKINIFVNGGDSNKRKRFTIAHEIAHYFLHFDTVINAGIIDNKYIGRDLSKTKIEKEANQLAAEILMPEDIVIQKATKLQNIPLLADFFNVSEDSMYYRLMNLGLI